MSPSISTEHGLKPMLLLKACSQAQERNGTELPWGAWMARQNSTVLQQNGGCATI